MYLYQFIWSWLQKCVEYYALLRIRPDHRPPRRSGSTSTSNGPSRPCATLTARSASAAAIRTRCWCAAGCASWRRTSSTPSTSRRTSSAPAASAPTAPSRATARCAAARAGGRIIAGGSARGRTGGGIRRGGVGRGSDGMWVEHRYNNDLALIKSHHQGR